ncbi:SWI/SNF chromatin-remodeling complex subunit [Friedmanniomyces endolithicus]|nr:SWI/SNF chromatin-remodeling complex subunit [Friedmanniomyces endolithicus]
MAAPSPPASQTQWDGSAGAVQAPGHGDMHVMMNADSTANVNGKDAIREGKQMAKEVLGAAGIRKTMTPATPMRASPLPNGSAQTNGGPQLSRKRSRDGTQLPFKTEPAAITEPDGTVHSHDEVLLNRYLQRDMVHGAAMNEQGERSRALVLEKEGEKDFYLTQVKAARQTNPGSVFGYGYMGYGNRITEGKTQLVYSSMRGPMKGRKTRELHIDRKDNAKQAEQHEELVPVRLDIELDKLRIRDTFTWNLHEKLISPDMLTEYLLEDLRIPPETLHEVSRQVKGEMQEQIQNFYPHIIVEDGPLEPGQPYYNHKDDEMRILIKLNITIGRITLMDQFEWDLNNPLNSPEEFARHMAWENALSGEFTTAIAHSIREQSQLYTRSLYLTGHNFDGRPVEDLELKEAFLPTPIHSVFRPQNSQKDWMPYMYEMSEAEFERLETSMMREHRAQKRQSTRRGGPALPDLKDRQRTLRSLIVHSVIPGAVETFETTGIPKTRRGGKAGRRSGPRGDVDVDTDDLESGDESAPESPAPSALNAPGAGTLRTRGMRGAATAAQAAMRANYCARSATPDSQLLAPPDPPRTAPRRSMLRDGSVLDDSETLVVKLRIGRAKLKAWWEEYRAKKRASEYPLSGYASQPAPPPAKTPGTSALAKGGSLSTPTMTSKALPLSRTNSQPNGHHRARSSTRNITYDARGGADTDHWPKQDELPPPPPPWLNTAITYLRTRHPDSEFEPLMRPYATSTEDGVSSNSDHHQIKIPPLEPGAPPPEGVQIKFLPRIRCNDCPGKLYTAQPGKVVEDFEVHLKNRLHRAAVGKRRQMLG